MAPNASGVYTFNPAEQKILRCTAAAAAATNRGGAVSLIWPVSLASLASHFSFSFRT